MLFYKIEGSLVKIDAENEDSRKAHRANVRRIAIKSDEFNEKFCRDSFFFVSNSSDGILTVGVIAERQGKIKETLKAYLKHIECELADIVVTEITFNSMFLSAIGKFMEMKTITAPLIRELIDHIEVHETQGEGKYKTQRIVIFYRFVGYIEIPEMALNQGITKDTRQGVSVSYIPKAITA